MNREGSRGMFGDVSMEEVATYVRAAVHEPRRWVAELSDRGRVGRLARVGASTVDRMTSGHMHLP